MEVQACRVCLTTERQLHSLCEKSLKNAFEDITGFTITLNNSLPKHICFVCKALLLRYSKFKKHCQHVQELLETRVYNNVQITQDEIKDISASLPSENLTFSKTIVINTSIANKSELQHINDFIQNNLILSGEPETSDNVLNVINNGCPEYVDVNIKNECPDEAFEGFDDGVLTNDDDDKELNKNDEIFTKNDDIGSCLNNEGIVNKIDEDLSETNKIYYKTNKVRQRLKQAKRSKRKRISRNKYNNNENIPLIKLKEVINKNRVKNLVKSDSEESVRKRVKWSESMNEMNLTKYNMKLRFLTKEEQLQKMLSRKESVKYKKSRFKCELCCKPYMTEKAFEKHNTLHQASADRPEECKLCHVYLGVRQHKDHLRAHRTELTCALCLREIEPRTSAVRNHSAFHAGVKFECKECKKVYHHYSTYINHKSARHSDTVCSLCGDIFYGHLGIGRHMHKSHPQASCEQCDKCKHYFCNKEARQQHKDTCNTGISPCGWCGASVRCASELRAHIASAHRAPSAQTHDCSECERSFIKEKTLITHWRKEHQGKTFIRRAPRPKTRRGGQVAKAADQKPKKNCICDQCGEMLLSSCHLRIHMLKHTGEKPHHCDQCNKSFRLAAQLRLHARVHSGEKPYQCSECATAFRQISHLNGHMRMHTGERPYKCEVCHKAFSLKINRDEHVRTVHEGKPPRRRNGKRGKYTHTVD